MYTYKVVAAESLDNFVALVNKATAEGFIPNGGLVVKDSEGYTNNHWEKGVTFYQAMIKVNDNTELK